MLLTVLAAGLVLSAEAPPSLAVLELSAAGVDPKRSTAFTEYLGEKLSRQGVQVTTPSALQAVLGLERQRQLVGCSTGASSCLAEIGAALGVDGIVNGTVAASEGGGFVVTLKVLSARNGEVWASDSSRVSSEGALLDFLEASSARLVATLYERLGRAAPRSSARVGRIAGWALVGAGAVAEGVGIGLFAAAKGAEGSLARHDPSIPDLTVATQVANQGRAMQTASAVTVALGGLALAGGLVLVLTQSGESAAVALAPSPGGGATVQLGGRF